MSSTSRARWRALSLPRAQVNTSTNKKRWGSPVVAVVLAFATASVLGASLPARAANDYLLMPRSELLSLPTSGAAWGSLKKVADENWGLPALCDQNVKHGVKALAGALVYARTGAPGYYTKTRNAIMTAIGTERPDCSVLSLGRQVGSYVLAADFINLQGFDDLRFRSWLSLVRTRTFTFHTRWQVLRGTHGDANNNWGAFAGASRIAASLYLGDAEDVSVASRVVRGFMGDRNAWDKFKGQGSKNGILEDATRVWACEASADGFVPINPSCSKAGINLSGAIVGDVWRDEAGLRWPVGPSGIGYTLESLQGLALQTELLYRNGYPNAWEWSDRALRRTADLVSRNAAAGGTGWNPATVSHHVPWLLNYRYGLNLPTKPARFGRVFGYTDWLYGGRPSAARP